MNTGTSRSGKSMFWGKTPRTCQRAATSAAIVTVVNTRVLRMGLLLGCGPTNAVVMAAGCARVVGAGPGLPNAFVTREGSLKGEGPRRRCAVRSGREGGEGPARCDDTAGGRL